MSAAVWECIEANGGGGETPPGPLGLHWVGLHPHLAPPPGSHLECKMTSRLVKGQLLLYELINLHKGKKGLP